MSGQRRVREKACQTSSAYDILVRGRQDDKKEAGSGGATGRAWHGRQDFTRKHETGGRGIHHRTRNSKSGSRALKFESLV